MGTENGEVVQEVSSEFFDKMEWRRDHPLVKFILDFESRKRDAQRALDAQRAFEDFENAVYWSGWFAWMPREMSMKC